MEHAPPSGRRPAPGGPGEQATRGDSDPPTPGPSRFAVAEHLEVVDSTNRYLVDLVRSGLPDGSEVPEGYAVTAEEQLSGRGRLGRRWEAPRASAVLCSVVLRPDVEPRDLHLATWAVALSAADACQEVAGVTPLLKWPNDLLVSDLKIAGLLAEVVPAKAAVVVGVGVNVNWPKGWPPQPDADREMPAARAELAGLSARATSLGRLAGRLIDREALVSALLANLAARAPTLGDPAGRRALASEYRRRSATIGREVRVELLDETVTGTALDVDDGGHLLVQGEVCLRSIDAGDVVHLR